MLASERVNFQSLRGKARIMIDLDLKASELVLLLDTLTQFEIALVAGIMAERRPVLAQQLSAALKLNLDEIYGENHAINS
jgi:hypothetical protein